MAESFPCFSVALVFDCLHTLGFGSLCLALSVTICELGVLGSLVVQPIHRLCRLSSYPECRYALLVRFFIEGEY